jgi:uncharacterized protein involved in exopolysaccharide biosynthesis
MNNIEPTASLRDFLNVIFKYKAKILTLFLATVITVAVGSFIMKPTYEATSQVLVKIGRENIYVPTSPTATSTSPIFSFSREEQINSEIEILKSRYLLEKVIDTIGAATIYPDLKSDGTPSLLEKTAVLPFIRRLTGNKLSNDNTSPRDKALLRLWKKLSVEGVKKSDVINVSFRSHDPIVTKDVANTLVNYYLDHHLTVHKNPMAYDFFQDQARLLEAKLGKSERALEAFKKEYAVISLEEQRSLLLEKSADLAAALNTTLSQIQESTTKVEKLRKQLSGLSPNVELEKNIGGNPYVINSLKAKLVELELKERELLRQYTEKNRLVVNVRQDIKAVRERLSHEQTQVYEGSRSGINITYKECEGKLLAEEATLKALKARKTSQRGHLAQYTVELEKLNRAEVDLNNLEHQVEINRQNYKLYLTKLEESRISNAMDMEKIANVSVIQPAQVPIKPIKPRKALNIILSILLGGIGSLGLAFFSEYMDHSLKTPEEVETRLQLPHLISIPNLKRRHRIIK